MSEIKKKNIDQDIFSGKNLQISIMDEYEKYRTQYSDPYGDFSAIFKKRPGKKILAKICNYVNDYRSFRMAGEHIGIPSYIRDIPVTIIGQFVFSHIEMKSISLPKELQIIEMGAFSSNKLEEVHLPESLLKIDIAAFADNNLTEIYIPKNVKTINDAAFDKNPLKKITIPSGIEIKCYTIDGIWRMFCLCYLKNKRKGGTYVFDENSWTLKDK